MIKIKDIYNKLYKHYGSQYWWPGDSPFEITIGAILTQNTSWSNVEKAIINLKPFLEIEILYNMEEEKLGELIKPSGFYNIKAKRIKNFLRWFEEKDFSFEKIEDLGVKELREQLLCINGIGRETADSIILYALEKPIFVIDAYTRRMFKRLGLQVPGDYDEVRDMFENNLENDIKVFNEYHALIVRHSKEYCRKKPLCEKCFLRDECFNCKASQE